MVTLLTIQKMSVMIQHLIISPDDIPSTTHGCKGDTVYKKIPQVYSIVID